MKPDPRLDEFALQRKREENARHKRLRQHRIALFPVAVIQMANDMHKAIELAQSMEGTDDDSFDSVCEYIDTMEQKIRDEFKATFGHDMIADTKGDK